MLGPDWVLTGRMPVPGTTARPLAAGSLCGGGYSVALWPAPFARTR